MNVENIHTNTHTHTRTPTFMRTYVGGRKWCKPLWTVKMTHTHAHTHIHMHTCL